MSNPGPVPTIYTDTDPQRTFLGYCLQETKLPDGIDGKLKPEDFGESYRLIARAIFTTARQGPCDVVAVAAEMEKQGAGIFTAREVAALAESAPFGPPNVENLITLIKSRPGVDGDAPEEDLPAFPESVITGVAGDVAAAYTEVLESPIQFLFTDALAYLGALVCTFTRIEGEVLEEPRLYLVKLGPSAFGGKSVSQESQERLHWPLFEDRVKHVRGVGSAEGLASALKPGLPVILSYDELRSLIDKMGIQHSVLLTMLTSLYSATKWSNYTKGQALEVSDAHLTVVGSCTTETFQSMFSPQFRAVGLLNRLFLVAGKRIRKHALSGSLHVETILNLRDRVRRQVERAELERPLLSFTPEAARRYTEWYMALPESQYTARLESYAYRFLTLYSVTTESRGVSLENVDAVIRLMEYQLALRRQVDPIDADSTVARMEGAILRALGKGRMGEGRLMKAVHVERHGLWCYGAAVKNLIEHQLIRAEQTRAPKEGAKAKGRAFLLTPLGMQRLEAMEG